MMLAGGTYEEREVDEGGLEKGGVPAQPKTAMVYVPPNYNPSFSAMQQSRMNRNGLFTYKTISQEISTITESEIVTGNGSGVYSFHPQPSTPSIVSIGFDGWQNQPDEFTINANDGTSVTRGPTVGRGTVNINNASTARVVVAAADPSSMYSITVTRSEQRVFYQQDVYFLGVKIRTIINYHNYGTSLNLINSGNIQAGNGLKDAWEAGMEMGTTLGGHKPYIVR